jgi:hypothetical protein
MVEQENRVVVTGAQGFPESCQAHHSLWTSNELVRIIEKIFIQNDSVIDDIPPIEQASGSGCDE